MSIPRLSGDTADTALISGNASPARHASSDVSDRGIVGTAVKGTAGLLLLSGLLACAGMDLVRPASDDFKLGQTTYAQVTQQMGEPRRTGDALKNGKKVKTSSYAYASKAGQASELDVTPARVQLYYFHNDTLVGQEFISSFKSDSSNFDEKKVVSIEKGQMTRVDVIKLMGEPTARFIPPMVKETSGEAIGYTYTAVRGSSLNGLKASTKSLRVSFNDQGLVSDVEYASSDGK